MRPGTVTLSPLSDTDRARIAAGLSPTLLTDLDRVALRVIEAASGDHFYGAWKGGTKAAGGGPADAAKALRRVEREKATGKTPYKSSASFNSEVNAAMTRAGVKHTGEPGTGVVFKTATGRQAVYFGPNGKPAGSIHVGGSTGHRIDLVEVNPAQRGKGIGTAMYDWAQDGGHVDLYAAIGKSHDFTVAGKTFAQSWLTHRVAIEAERAGIREAATGSRAKYDQAKAALAHVSKAPVSASGMPSPEEGDTKVAEAFAAFLAERGGDHFYGAWKGGKSKGGGGAPEGVKGIPHTDGIDNHPDGAPKKPDVHSTATFATADPGDRVEVLVATGKRAQSVRGVITARTDSSITVNADGTSHTFGLDTMRHMRVTHNGLTGDVSKWFMGLTGAPKPVLAHVQATNPFDAHLHRSGVKPGANTWAAPIAKATSSIRFELSAREAAFEAFLIDLDEKSSDDHFYGAWRGGKASQGGSPVGEDTMRQHTDTKGQWSAERVAAVHQPYIESTMAGVPKTSSPTVYMTGGGPAAGKTKALLSNPKTGIPGKTKAAHIDPDGAKAAIPEYKAGIKSGDRTIASHVHEESSHMSKAAIAANLQAGHHVVYDSVGDSGIAKLSSKVQQMRDMGAKRVEATYATVSIETAIARSDARALKTGRFVPHAFITQAHQDVTRSTLAAIDKGIFDKLAVWDNNGPTPLLIATATPKGGLRIRDKAAWAAFLEKAGLD